MCLLVIPIYLLLLLHLTSIPSRMCRMLLVVVVALVQCIEWLKSQLVEFVHCSALHFCPNLSSSCSQFANIIIVQISILQAGKWLVCLVAPRSIDSGFSPSFVSVTFCLTDRTLPPLNANFTLLPSADAEHPS